MKLLFASGNPYPPEPAGGAERTVDDLAMLLRRRNHTVEMVTSAGKAARRRRLFQLRRILSAKRWLGWTDGSNGYPTHRTRADLLPRLFVRRLESLQPDLVLCQQRFAEACVRLAVERGVPALLWVHDTTFAWHHGELAGGPGVRLLGCSRFVADAIASRLKRSATVLYPLIRFDLARVDDHQPRHVLFINTSPRKGLETAIEIATALPHRSFVFVECEATPANRRALRTRLARLDNVRLEPWRRSVSSLYRRAAVLLVPSLGEEAFGRVVVEAQVNGIPVLARRIGGLPEALGEGGILLPAEAPAEEWSAALECLLSDPEQYRRLSERARASARRPELQPERLVARFEELAAEHVRARRRGPA